ncbi:MAG: hypothetical protein NC420_06650 [Eubacterium sp.]|nr:hypothetical protein [Eubacterium sp.]MCM1214816.1 hypothetical protein [Lachnospiraceae bacterium]MCM1305557.1 hypothetical protein [Butyrivibrio sp.]MCM1344272.1 hypothetical protein [Muribaculaceae bacterium]MCM1241185.1 hypothetical protein [Lachnospiraceae bacterium]
MENSEEKRIAGGFLFLTEKEAKLAEVERKKIAYLESKIDYSKPEDILYIYDKTVKENVFSTPVGMMYLKQLQEFLLNQGGVDPASVAAIPLSNTYQEYGKAQSARERMQARHDQEMGAKKSQLTVSVILNLLLALAMIAMFVISLNSDSPNIINYKRVITDQYASWEQELTERESVVREKERELLMEEETSADGS